MAKQEPVNDNADEGLTDEEKAAKAAEEKKAAAAKADDLSEDDLNKSLDRLNDIATAGDEPARKQVLLKKAQEEELSKAEKDELFDLMGDKPAAESLADAATAGIAGSEAMKKAIDVSEFLEEQNAEYVKALGVLAKAIEGIDARQHEFNLVLAKAVADEGAMIHKMGQRLGVIENQPARPPKSKGVNTPPLRKSFGGEQPEGPGGELSKSEVMGALYEMVEKSVDAGQAGVAGGENLVTAVAKFEQFNTLSPNVLRQIQAHLASKGAAIH